MSIDPNPDGNNIDDQNLPNGEPKNPPEPKSLTDEEKHAAEIEAIKKDMKDKLDRAYAARDDALRVKAELEQKERDAELKRLQDEGKHKEAFEMQLADEKAKREAAEKKIVSLTRDTLLKDVLSSYDFRNNDAKNMAFSQIVGELVQDEKGEWLHKSGVSIEDYAKVYSENKDKEFLFKPVISTGGGTTTVRTSPSTEKPKSLFDISQDDVLKMAQEGKLPKRR